VAAKLGPPEPGTARQLTSGEAKVLGCSAKWWIRVGPDGGLTILQPRDNHLWTIAPVMSPAQMTSIRDRLGAFWAKQRTGGMFLTADSRLRIAATARDALAYAPAGLRRDLQWVVDTVS
jgi:hypothetical protein